MEKRQDHPSGFLPYPGKRCCLENQEMYPCSIEPYHANYLKEFMINEFFLQCKSLMGHSNLRETLYWDNLLLSIGKIPYAGALPKPLEWRNGWKNLSPIS